MAANPQPEPQPNKLTIQGVARLAGFMVSTIRKWQRDGKVPSAPTDGNYSPEYVEILQTYRKNTLSAQSKSRWAKLTPEERTEVAKKQWTPERRKTQSITMRNVRLGLTGFTPEELKEWNANSKNAADTQEVRKAKGRGADDLWARRDAESAQADLQAKQADAAVAAAQAEVNRLAGELAQAKTELAKAKAAKAEALPLADTVRKKLDDPANYMWMSPDEVAQAFGIVARTFYRNVDHYHRLRPNGKGWYLTTSVIEQLKSLPRKK